MKNQNKKFKLFLPYIIIFSYKDLDLEIGCVILIRVCRMNQCTMFVWVENIENIGWMWVEEVVCPVCEQEREWEITILPLSTSQ
jgi:hypothetical protein